MTVLALLAMVLQLFFSTAHLAAQARGYDAADRSDQTIAFWEICTGRGLISASSLSGQGGSDQAVPAYDICSICCSAIVAGFLVFSDDLPLFHPPHPINKFVRPPQWEAHTFEMFPHNGDIRAPPRTA